MTSLKKKTPGGSLSFGRDSDEVANGHEARGALAAFRCVRGRRICLCFFMPRFPIVRGCLRSAETAMNDPGDRSKVTPAAFSVVISCTFLMFECQ
jgi:hypothetical protein